MGEPLVAEGHRAPPQPQTDGSLARRLVELLDVEFEDLVVGLGAGSFGHCLSILERMPLRHQLVLVDGSRRRLNRLADLPTVRLVNMGALEFARFPIQWDKILLDELPAEDGAEADDLLRLLFARIRPGGRLAAILPVTALPRATALQRSLELGARVRDSGFAVSFETVEQEMHRYGLVVGAKRAPS